MRQSWLVVCLFENPKRRIEGMREGWIRAERRENEKEEEGRETYIGGKHVRNAQYNTGSQQVTSAKKKQ